MKKIILIPAFLLMPVLGLAAGDITVNDQSIYAVPPGTTGVLILDLTLPENLTSIKILNLGYAQQWDISAMYIFEDGLSLGWDGDEKEIFRKSSSPFWDTEISVNSSNPRIFVTLDIASTAASDKTVKPQATINSDKTIVGFERTISAGTSMPQVPVAPLAGSGQALSTSTIRWNFLDLANNEFSFRIKDSSLKIAAEVIQSNLSYIDETGLEPNTCYSGRRAYALNDRGESSPSMNFAEVCTLALSTTPTPTPSPIPSSTIAPVPEPEPEMSQADKLKAQIMEVQQKIIDLLNQLIQLISEQLKVAQASLFNTFETITSWLESRF